WRGHVLAWECGLKKIICQTDCLEIFLLLQNNAEKTQCGNSVLVIKIVEILLRNWVVHFEHIHQEENRAAD
ncbi:hypothetical protein PIB30_102852, partial [Stylosanthes scabra]|nr:hypothetical protein [Stylosanthes scabra]